MARAKNERIKKAHTVTEYTPEQLDELEKCAADPIYFCRTYIKVQHPTKGAIPLELYDYQEEMIRMFIDERYSIVLSARQTGKCCLESTRLNTLTAPSNLKKVLLWIFNRRLYNAIFNTQL